MDPAKALALFNNELRTTYLNVLGYSRREKKAQRFARIYEFLTALGIVLALAFWHNHWIALPLQLMAAIAAILRVGQGLKGSLAKYSGMRSRYYGLYIDAMHTHSQFINGSSDLAVLQDQCDSLVRARKELAQQEELFSREEIQKLQDEVSEHLPIERLCPDRFRPMEE